MSTPSGLAAMIQGKFQPRPEPDLHVGDLVMWDGKPSEHGSFRHGIIYRVVGRTEPGEKTTYDIPRYQFLPVFDFSRPMGTAVESFDFSTIRDLKKLNLLDLGTLRLHYDNFIREWAKSCGMEVDEAK